MQNKRLEFRSIENGVLITDFKGEQILTHIEDAIEMIILFTKRGIKHGEISEMKRLPEENWLSIKWIYKVNKKSGVPKELIQGLIDDRGKDYSDKFIQKLTDEIIDDDANFYIDKRINRTEKVRIARALMYLENYEMSKEIVNEAIKTVKPLKKFHTKKKEANGSILFMNSDFHLGNENHEDVMRRFRQITVDMVSKEESHIDEINPGDLVENFTEDGMHGGDQIRSEYFRNTSDLVKCVLGVYIERITELTKSGKTYNLYITNGNHDRPQVEHKNFGKSLLLETIITSLEMYFKDFDNVSINYYGRPWNKFILGNGIQTVLWHGDDRLHIPNKGKMIERCLMTGTSDSNKMVFDLNEPILFVHGHDHYAQCELYGTKQAQIGAGTLAGNGEYGQNLGYETVCSYYTLKLIDNKFKIDLIILD